MPLQYAPGEITLPSGVSRDDLDWVVFSWDLYLRDAGSDKFYQVVLAPGVLQTRYGGRSADIFRKVAGRVQGWDTRNGKQMAIKKTNEKLAKGYQYVCAPFLFDLNSVNIPGESRTLVEKYSTDPNINSAGDLVHHDYSRCRTDFYRTLFARRDEVRADKNCTDAMDPKIWVGL